jgi:hypothetical protein
MDAKWLRLPGIIHEFTRVDDAIQNPSPTESINRASYVSFKV